MGIRGVVWDFERVLLQSDGGGFERVMASRLGVPLEKLVPVLDSPMTKLWDLSEIDDDEYYLYILRQLGLPASMKTVLERSAEEDYFIDQALLSYIRDLHASYKTALLTNFPSHIHDFMRFSWQVDGAFDHIVASCDVKLLKPDPRIFRLTLERLGIPPAQAIMVDDQPANVHAAQEMGMGGVIFQDRVQAIADLEAMLLEKA